MDSKPPEDRVRVLRRSMIAMLTCAVVLAAGTTPPSQATTDYPNKPVRLFVPYGPGGVGDLTMRLLADQLSKELKQQFVIENRPGAGGIVAMTEVLKAPADGYTLAEMGNGQAISMSLFNNLLYNVLNDFAQISVAASFEMLLAVPDKSPYETLKDLVAEAQKNPRKLNLGAINPGSTQNLSLSYHARFGDRAAAW
jgi:putative tricarboxylic transport membrane protein